VPEGTSPPVQVYAPPPSRGAALAAEAVSTGAITSPSKAAAAPSAIRGIVLIFTDTPFGVSWRTPCA
jgi:hypothetical protein